MLFNILIQNFRSEVLNLTFAIHFINLKTFQPRKNYKPSMYFTGSAEIMLKYRIKKVLELYKCIELRYTFDQYQEKNLKEKTFTALKNS